MARCGSISHLSTWLALAVAVALLLLGGCTRKQVGEPVDDASRARAFRALVSCPTGSIGCNASTAKRGIAEASGGFSVLIDGPTDDDDVSGGAGRLRSALMLASAATS